MAEPETARDAAAEPVLVSHLKFGEALGVLMQLRAKVEAEWHRVVYLHAAMIGVMIFFAGQSNPFVTARLVVFTFYTFNVALVWFSLYEAYEGMRQLTRDLLLFPAPERGGHTIEWLRGRNYKHDALSRALLLGIVWAVVGYLLILPLIVGRTPGMLGPGG